MIAPVLVVRIRQYNNGINRLCNARETTAKVRFDEYHTVNDELVKSPNLGSDLGSEDSALEFSSIPVPEPSGDRKWCFERLNVHRQERMLLHDAVSRVKAIALRQEVAAEWCGDETGDVEIDNSLLPTSLCVPMWPIVEVGPMTYIFDTYKEWPVEPQISDKRQEGEYRCYEYDVIGNSAETMFRVVDSRPKQIKRQPTMSTLCSVRSPIRPQQINVFEGFTQGVTGQRCGVLFCFFEGSKKGIMGQPRRA